MNVFVAGGTGVVGRPSIGILVKRGHRVFAMTRHAELEDELWAAGAIPVIQDAFDADALTRKMKAIKPEAVIHQLTDLALLHDPSKLREAFERNTRLRQAGTANLVAAMVAAGVEHIVAQSIAWFYRAGPEPYREEAPLDVHASGLRGVSVEGVVALERSVLERAAAFMGADDRDGWRSHPVGVRHRQSGQAEGNREARRGPWRRVEVGRCGS